MSEKEDALAEDTKVEASDVGEASSETIVSGTAASAEGSAELAPKELPINTCNFCGPLKPGEPVYQCPLCMQYVCIWHLDGKFHHCTSLQN